MKFLWTQQGNVEKQFYKNSTIKYKLSLYNYYEKYLEYAENWSFEHNIFRKWIYSNFNITFDLLLDTKLAKFWWYFCLNQCFSLTKSEKYNVNNSYSRGQLLSTDDAYNKNWNIYSAKLKVNSKFSVLES